MEVRDRLTYLANFREINFFKDHVKYLQKLKSEGLEPKVIYDIGSCVLHWTNEAKNIWTDAKYVLFDAFEPAEFLYEGYDYHIGVLSDSNKTVEWWQNDMMPGGNSYYREIGRTDFFTDGMSTMRPTKTLDEVVRERGFPKPDFIKIDVQGCELDILKGATETLKSVKDLVVELQHTEYNKGAPQVQESLPFIESLGFKCVSPMFAYNGPDADYHFTRI
jgi:FkbM family methyltransferase